ncbi:hypothetical protein PTKIN_Ptkin18bG0102900 [Pterospermum kingtungense]
MGVEENLKSFSINEEEDNKNPNPNPNVEEEEVEEGEIVGEENGETTSLKKCMVEQQQTLTHLLLDLLYSLYNNIHHPSKLAVGADFHCFKYKIEPKWEDPVCANGGKWTLTFQRGKSDTCWLYTLLALIGEQFEYGDEICGAVVNISIGKQWKELLDYNDSIGFIFHEDAKKHDRAAKNRYTLHWEVIEARLKAKGHGADLDPELFLG